MHNILDLLLEQAKKKRKANPQKAIPIHRPEALQIDYYTLLISTFNTVINYAEKALFTESGALNIDHIESLHADSLAEQLITIFENIFGWLRAFIPEYPPDPKTTILKPPTLWLGLGKLADSVNTFNGKQMDRMIESTIGITFPRVKAEEVVLGVTGTWWEPLRKEWIQTNYETIRSLSHDNITKLNEAAEKAVTQGWSVQTLREEIQKIDDRLTKGHATFLARDQISRLNGEITRARMESIGLKYYRWRTCKDERVRGNPNGRFPSRPNTFDSHYDMEGLMCRWDNPVICSYDLGKSWVNRPLKAPLLYPGQDYQCRCVAVCIEEELFGEIVDVLEPPDEDWSD
jgi:hypothetical protein